MPKLQNMEGGSSRQTLTGITPQTTPPKLYWKESRECVYWESGLKITPNFSFAMFACEKRYVWPSLFFLPVTGNG